VSHQKSTFQAGMSMKTNESVRGPKSDAVDPWALLAVKRPYGRLTFQAGMSMKTKGREEQRPSNSFIPMGRKAKARSQEIKVHPEILLKTKGRENEQAPTSAIPGSSVATSSRSGILAPVSCLLAPFS